MNLADKNKCCGCCGCQTICPFNAIKMQCDEEGFLYPFIDDALCKKCGKCEKVCPITNREKICIDTHNKKVIQGFFVNEDKHRASASGGAATAFSEMIINSGGCVFGSAYTEDYKDAIYIKVTNVDELNKLKSSKYIETTKGTIYEQVKEEVNTGRKVLFTGLPCDIGGLKAYLGSEYKNLYTCELICHGPTAKKVQEDYINKLSRKYRSKVIGFNSRYNVDGKEAPYIKVDFENGKSYVKPLWDTEYGYAFAIYSRKSCYNCSFKGNMRVADISIGDSWCARESFGDKKGVSIIYAHTEKGMELIDYAEKICEFESQKLFYENIKNDNPAIWRCLDIRPERNIFAYEINKNDLLKATIKSKKLIDRIKFLIKYMR